MRRVMMRLCCIHLLNIGSVAPDDGLTRNKNKSSGTGRQAWFHFPAYGYRTLLGVWMDRGFWK